MNGFYCGCKKTRELRFRENCRTLFNEMHGSVLRQWLPPTRPFKRFCYPSYHQKLRDISPRFKHEAKLFSKPSFRKHRSFSMTAKALNGNASFQKQFPTEDPEVYEPFSSSNAMRFAVVRIDCSNGMNCVLMFVVLLQHLPERKHAVN